MKAASINKYILLSTGFFLTIFSYYLIKPISRSLYLEYLGSANLPYVWIASATILLMIMPAYNLFVNKLGRFAILIWSVALFLITLLSFKYLFLLHSKVGAISFYIITDIFSVLLVEQFWSLCNSVCAKDESKSVYGIVGSGGLLGGILGGVATSTLLKSYQIEESNLLLLAGFFAVLLIPIYFFIKKQNKLILGDAKISTVKTKVSNKYLLLIVALIGIAQLIEPLIEFKLMASIEANISGLKERASLVANVLSYTSSLALIFNLLLTPLILKRFGLFAGLATQPIMILIFGVLFAFYGSLIFIVLLKISDRGLSYSINRASKEILYIPLNANLIYKAKAWIDMFGYRAFKVLGSFLIILLTAIKALYVVNILIILLCLIWIIVVRALSKEKL